MAIISWRKVVFVCVFLTSASLVEGNGSKLSLPKWMRNMLPQYESPKEDRRQQSNILDCTNLATGETVVDGKCEGQKPEIRTRGCGNVNCPPKWEPEPWATCTVSCGTGTQVREVYCIQQLSNGINLRLSDEMCAGNKPPSVQACNTDPCPYWKPEPWSQCSVSCGRGISIREIQCQNHRNKPAMGCDVDTMPSIRKICLPGVPCLRDPDSVTKAGQRPHLMTTASPEEFINNQEGQQLPSYHSGDWSPCSTSCGPGIRTRSVRCKVYLQGYDAPFDLSNIECQGVARPDDVEDCLMAACPPAEQADALHGPVVTVATIGATRTTTTTHEPTEAPNVVDPAPNPTAAPNVVDPVPNPTSAPNVVDPAPNPTVAIELGPDLDAFIWRYVGYAPCSASCIGGVQESNVRCVNAFTDEVVSEAHCDYSQKLPSIQRPCNEHDCPPEWKVFFYSECSSQCGPGTMDPLDILCIQMTARNSGIPVRTLPDDRCLAPRPSEPLPCEGMECTAFWVIGDWSECSATCGEGAGNMTRSLACHQATASGGGVEVDFERCPEPTPHTVEECDNFQCPPYWKAAPTSECSKSCGRGMQSVALTCHQMAPFGGEFEMDPSLCPIPPPPSSQPCGEVDCPTEWTTKLLSECSATCGVGIRLRSVLCSRLLGNGTRVIVDAYQCSPSLRPADSVVCNLPKCTEIRILANYSTYRQRSILAGKVRLVVGQEAFVFSGTTITVKCPVLNYKKGAVRWDRGRTPIAEAYPSSGSEPGRVKMVTGGILRLKHAQPSDSGVYACRAGDRKETFILHVQDPPASPVQLNKPSYSTLSPASASNTRWVTSAWNECSVSCGRGTQIRDIVCERIDLMGRSKPRGALICKKAGLDEPEASRACNTQPCTVHWATEAWSPCRGECVEVEKSVQRRRVYCRSPTRDVLPDEMCGQQTRPQEEQLCDRPDCRPKWLATRWSSCSSTCGAMAVQKRKIRCVAVGTREQMDSGICAAVFGEPPIMKKCLLEPCPGEECSDEGVYCSLVQRLHMCTNPSYQRRCCKSCQANGG